MEALVFWSKSFRGISLLWIFSYLFTTGAFNIGTNWCLESKKSCLVCDSGELNNAFVLRASGSYTKSEYPQAPFVKLDVFIGKWGNLFNYWPEMNVMRMKLHFFLFEFLFLSPAAFAGTEICELPSQNFRVLFESLSVASILLASYLHQNGDLRFVKQKDCFLRALKNGSMTEAKLTWKCLALPVKVPVSGHPQSEQSAFVWYNNLIIRICRIYGDRLDERVLRTIRRRANKRIIVSLIVTSCRRNGEKRGSILWHFLS